MHAITNRSNDGARASIAGDYRPPTGRIVYSPTEETFQSILDNDPGIVGVHFYCTEDLVELAGRAVSQSIHLRTLKFDRHLLTDSPEMLSSFLKRLAENRSIEHLSLSGIDGVDFITILAPFFTFNHNLRCIEIKHATLSTGMTSLISVVKSSREWQLERIKLFSCRIGDECIRDLIEAFNSSPGLRHLRELCLSSNQVGQLGCTAIGKLLKNSECSVRTLELGTNDLDDSCIVILVDAFIVNSTLKCVALENQKFVTSAGWCVFSTYLSHPNCSVGIVRFRENDILNDAVLTMLGMALAANKTVTRVDISHSLLFDATVFGWSRFSTCLRCPTSVLEELILDHCNISDEGAVVLAVALSENTSLKKLSMSENRSISSSGWVDCLNLLLGPNSKLLYLDLIANNVDDAGARLLARRLGNSTLSQLDLKDCTNITTDGLRAIAVALRSSTLHHILFGPTRGILDDTNEDAFDDIMIFFAEALKFNSSLRLLRGFSLSDIGCSALANALCDTSSIENTFISNHTLSTLLNASSNERLAELLCMNTDDWNKASVARKKILKYHFTDVDNCARVFGSMEVKVLPTAISWIGRDNLGFSLMYNFLRSMPWLIKPAATGRVRTFVHQVLDRLSFRRRA